MQWLFGYELVIWLKRTVLQRLCPFDYGAQEYPPPVALWSYFQDLVDLIAADFQLAILPVLINFNFISLHL